jgi:hypothetical protein
LLERCIHRLDQKVVAQTNNRRVRFLEGQ